MAEKWESYCHCIQENLISGFFPPPVRNVQSRQFSYSLSSYTLQTVLKLRWCWYAYFSIFGTWGNSWYQLVLVWTLFWKLKPSGICSDRAGTINSVRNVQSRAFAWSYDSPYYHHLPSEFLYKCQFLSSTYNWHNVYGTNCSCFNRFHAEIVPF